ncbi:4-diphosphocytidyl-2-C-methyl-D-erythritol kinase [Spiroplasma corruscae]|uniref:4-diphosphocytidyl-2-C-methyl-D-erythritol kinase n=1 Tax=Spiroplasma corruscae TaxID=216934 RepID=A0A222ERD3_9MOLU|nr:hypothetical protein [Spiroplasma corruscae]ASP28764.1 4-diphosphocytidyl-2-C-methyl-D-erythritol kinase [Spiroplasma corruscae]
MRLRAYAKVNIWLKVWKKDYNSQYHLINSLVVKVKNLYDSITISKSNNDFDEISSNLKVLEKENFIFNVLDILRKHNITKNFYKVKLKKRIPLGAGLGGGTSDAITLAKYFLRKYKIIDSNINKEICKAVGFDSYFYFSDFESAIVTGYGEKVETFFKKFKVYKKHLILTGVNCNTKKVYQEFDLTPGENNSIYLNSLTTTCIQIYPKLSNFIDKGVMSGSGSTFIKKMFYDKYFNKDLKDYYIKNVKNYNKM